MRAVTTYWPLFSSIRSPRAVSRVRAASNSWRLSALAPNSRTSCLKLARECGNCEMWAIIAASVIIVPILLQRVAIYRRQYYAGRERRRLGHLRVPRPPGFGSGRDGKLPALVGEGGVAREGSLLGEPTP